MSDDVTELLSLLEKRIDSQEELIANLLMAYAEVWVAIESVMNELMSSRTPDDQAKFMKEFGDFRMKMLQVLKEAGANGMAGDSPEPT